MNTIILVIIIIFSSHLLIANNPTVVADDRYIYSVCSRKNYTPGNTTYSLSLLYVVDVLCTNAPENNGFWNASWAKNPANRAYGLALCRANVSMDDCKTCLINATTLVISNTSCGDAFNATIWLDHCLLKYSNEPFFGQIDTLFVRSPDDDNATVACSVPNDTTKDLLNGLVNEISYDDQVAGVPLSAHGNMPNGNKTVYAMVQCTRDLTLGNCKACLNHAISSLLDMCLKKEDGTLLSGSCIARYAMYPFLEQ